MHYEIRSKYALENGEYKKIAESYITLDHFICKSIGN